MVEPIAFVRIYVGESNHSRVSEGWCAGFAKPSTVARSVRELPAQVDLVRQMQTAVEARGLADAMVPRCSQLSGADVMAP